MRSDIIAIHSVSRGRAYVTHFIDTKNSSVLSLVCQGLCGLLYRDYLILEVFPPEVVLAACILVLTLHLAENFNYM